MLKKIGLYLLGFFSAMLGILAGVWAALTFAPPTTEISGKVKAKKGGIANLDIASGQLSRREKWRQKRKNKKDARILKKY